MGVDKHFLAEQQTDKHRKLETILVDSKTVR